MTPEPILSPEQLAEVQAYHAPFYAWGLWGDALYLALLLTMIAFGVQPLHRGSVRLAAALSARLHRARELPVLRVLVRILDRLWGEPGWGAALVFAWGQCLLLELALLPKDVYFYYVHEHRFGLSTHTPASFAWDLAKGTAVFTVATGFLAFGLYGLARRLRRWWLVLGVAVGALMLISAALDSHRARLFYAQEPLPAGELRTRIGELLKKAEIDFADVRVEKTSVASRKLDAYFAGQGPTRAVILNDVLLERLETEEILAAVAHEAGHVKESRWPARIGAMFAAVGLLFLIDRVLREAARRKLYGGARFADIRTLPLLSLLYFLVTFPVNPISLAFSREREAEADRFAIALTGNPEAFRSMLVQAARVNKMDPFPPRWYVLARHSHPPLGERVAAVDALLEKKTLSAGEPP
jgi:STE24 endopeptidase